MFWDRVEESGDGCWNWKGAHLSTGYPFVEWKGSRTTAARVAYELINGEIPNGGFVKANCNNRNCINPEHLYVAPGNLKTNPEVLIRNAKIRFWRCVQKADGDACWVWTGPKLNSGYGVMRVNHKAMGAHRYSYELNVGPLEPNKVICHKCDNPICVRPDHLFQGTHRDNILDMHAKGRANLQIGDKNWRRRHPDLVPKGQDHHRALLTNEEAKLARVLYSQGVTQATIAEELRVDNTTISNIVRDKIYNIPEAQPKVLKKLVVRGDQNLLSEEDVQEMIKLFREGWLRSALAKKFKVPHCTISLILKKRGELQPKERISEDTVRAIRALGKSGMLYREIAQLHSVSVSSVSAICSGKAWAHVSDLP